MADLFPMQFDLRPNGGKLSFKTQEDLRAWAQKEQDDWAWLVSVANNGVIGGILNNGQLYVRSNLLKWVNALPSNPNQMIGSIHTVFNEYYRLGRAIVSTSPEGKFIASLVKSNAEMAAWALITLTNKQGRYFPLNNASQEAFNGIVKAILYLNGIKDAAPSEKSALDDLNSEYSQKIIDASNQISEQQSEYSNFKDVLVAQYDKFNEEIEKTVQDGTKKVDDLINQLKDRIGTIEVTYREKLSLQDPVTYWKKKAKNHLITLSILCAVLIAGMIGAVWGSYEEVKALLPNIEPGKFPDPWRLGLILITVTMAIWLLRLLAKVTLSQLHLFTDAQERTVLANAYLSLLHGDQGIRDSDRELILQVLFRSATSGIVDDGGPATPIEIATKIVGGK